MFSAAQDGCVAQSVRGSLCGAAEGLSPLCTQAGEGGTKLPCHACATPGPVPAAPANRVQAAAAVAAA
jgi:hypothetical protein